MEKSLVLKSILSLQEHGEGLGRVLKTHLVHR